MCSLCRCGPSINPAQPNRIEHNHDPTQPARADLETNETNTQPTDETNPQPNIETLEPSANPTQPSPAQPNPRV